MNRLDSRKLRVCVYCGSAPGNGAHWRAMATATGRAIADAGGSLVYGGSQLGLMGAVADAVLAAGGEVIGVMPRHLDQVERSHPGLTRLEVVATMHERKARMIELADRIVAIPGGIGTADELFEAWTWASIGLHDRPVALLDHDGYFDGLVRFMERARSEGFLRGAAAERLRVLGSVDAFEAWLREESQPA